MSVAEKLKKYLDERGIRTSFVAEKAGMNAELLQRSLNGNRKLTADEFASICFVLGLDLGFFQNPAEGMA